MKAARQKKAERARRANVAKTGDDYLAGAWKPNPGPQSDFFYSNCREILYGGQAGGGKSEALTALPLRWAHLPGFVSLTLRRTIKQARDLQRKSRKINRKALPGVDPVKQPMYSWPLPGGGESTYGHCCLRDDFDQYDGWEINLANFDELTHFTEEQYLAICARVRSADLSYRR